MPVPPPTPRISLVVPTWNGVAHLRALLPALAAQSERDFELIVVDNASGDGTLAWLRANPWVRVVAVAENTGFSGAINRGVLAARAELVLFLNNDMVPRRDFLAQLLDAADRHPEAGSLACRVLQSGRAGVIDSAGDGLCPSGRSRAIGRGQPDGPGFDDPRAVFAGTGGAVVYRAQALRDIGPLDRDFFLYLEDTDLAMRARLAGWSCRYVPTAVTEHVGGASLSGREDVRARYCLRNYLWFLLKSYPGALIVRFAPEVATEVARELSFAFTATRTRHGGATALSLVLRALSQALWLAPKMLFKRASLRRRAELHDLERAIG